MLSENVLETDRDCGSEVARKREVLFTVLARLRMLSVNVPDCTESWSFVVTTSNAT